MKYTHFHDPNLGEFDEGNKNNCKGHPITFAMIFVLLFAHINTRADKSIFPYRDSLQSGRSGI